jgi:group I intron endonuclease
MDAYGYIYITTNIINGKRYIGQHKSKDWDSKYIGSGKLLKYAIKKYGKENFTCFPLAWVWNEKELNQLEIDYIAHYKPEYNIDKGGNSGGMIGKKQSEETKLKMSKSKKGKIFSEEHKKKISEAKKNPSKEIRKKISEAKKGKKRSEETKRKISISTKGENNSMFGKHHSDEIKQKMSEARKRFHENKRIA